MGGTGRSASCRSLRTFTRLMRLFTSDLTFSSPHRESSSAKSSSRLGAGSAWTSASGFSSPWPSARGAAASRPAPGASLAGAGRRVTKSFTSSGAFSGLSPSLSHRAERVSAHWLTKAASSSLTTSSTAAKSRSIRVIRSINRRESLPPATLS